MNIFYFNRKTNISGRMEHFIQKSPFWSAYHFKIDFYASLDLASISQIFKYLNQWGSDQHDISQGSYHGYGAGLMKRMLSITFPTKGNVVAKDMIIVAKADCVINLARYCSRENSKKAQVGCKPSKHCLSYEILNLMSWVQTLLQLGIHSPSLASFYQGMNLGK